MLSQLLMPCVRKQRAVGRRGVRVKNQWCRCRSRALAPDPGGPGDDGTSPHLPRRSASRCLAHRRDRASWSLAQFLLSFHQITNLGKQAAVWQAARERGF